MRAISSGQTGKPVSTERMPMSPVINRRGLTVIDLLVVLVPGLAVLGMAASFLSRLQEQSAMAQSRNNLRQLALATHAYHDDEGCLPPIAGKHPDHVHGSILFHL